MNGSLHSGKHRRPAPRRPLRATVAMFLTACTAATSAAIIDKQQALDAQGWWDNRDWDWYKANIPFFECPDPEIVTTYYYRWELITKHLTYGSPESGYSFTEFIDRPFWSGAYGAISCPAGHQLYEVRWLHDSRYARDYARYWFRTPGAQPRNYGCWLADAIWATHLVHPDKAFVTDLLPDLIKNYEGWAQRQFVPEVGLFWQNGHDDGMEYNINSRQTHDIVRGANGYRPGFNAYMWADARAIAEVARLAGDDANARSYDSRAAAIKQKLQELLWDPQREFFFPMSMRDEKDKQGNVVRKHTLTYQSGKFAGNPHGREQHAYIPWQFNLPDPGYESAWKFLMDPEYFQAQFGPTTVERKDPMFLVQKTCCWWSGQSWPYSTAQTLKALANVLQNYRQEVITPADYLKLLQTYARTHRKNRQPYLAEACHPDNGSFEGHDSYNHSEHYFHSSFNDLLITGLIGLKPRADDVLELHPLAPADWPWFAIDDLPYRGHRLSVIWDRDGSRYGKGAGLRVLAEGQELASTNRLGKVLAKLPAIQEREPVARRAPVINFAVNNDGDYFPRLTASFTDLKTELNKANDGNYWYTIHPPNRWTTTGSTNNSDWLAVDFGVPRTVDTVKLYFLDDGGKVLAPESYDLEFWAGQTWKTVPGQRRHLAKPEGHRANVVALAALDTPKLRVVFHHEKKGRTGLTEIEAWGPGVLPHKPAPPPAGNLAANRTGEGFPKATASFSDRFGGKPMAAIDGKVIFRPSPMNRWTSFGSTNGLDWLEVDFGALRQVGRVDLHIYDDGGGVQPPANYNVQYWSGTEWRDADRQGKSPATPAGSMLNTVTFDRVTTSKVRVIFFHQGKARSGVTELEVWKE
jgi:hypothetical protein